MILHLYLRFYNYNIGLKKFLFLLEHRVIAMDFNGHAKISKNSLIVRKFGPNESLLLTFLKESLYSFLQSGTDSFRENQTLSDFDC